MTPRQRMIGVLSSWLLLFLAVAPLRAAEPDSKALPAVWTAQEAVRFARANSPDAKMAESRIAAAQAAITMERAAFFPRLDLNSQYSQTNNPMYSFGNILNQGVFHQGIDFNHPGQTDNLNLGVRLNYRLFSGGRDWAGLNAAEAHEVAAQMERDTVNAQLAFEVIRAFSLIQQAEGMVRAYEDEAKAIDAALAVAQARYGEGVLLKADLLDLEVQHAKARENLIQARHGLKVGHRIFRNLLGLPEGEVVLDPVGSARQEVPTDRGYDRRPELRGVEAVIQAARSMVRQATAGYYPTLDGYAGYGVDKGYELDGSGDSWEAGVQLKFNLFNGHQTQAEVARASAALTEAQERKRKAELALGLEVKQAEFALQEAEERLQVSAKSIEHAQESARINRLRYKEGVLLTADLIAVESRLTEAAVRRTVAETAQRIALAALRRAVGLAQFEELPASPPGNHVATD